MSVIRIATVGLMRLNCLLFGLMIAREADMQHLGSGSLEGDIQSVAQRFTSLGPGCDLVLIEPYQAEVQALKLVQVIRATYPKIKVVMLGLSPQDCTVLTFLEQGVAGYTLEHDSISTSLAKIRAIYQGQPEICPVVIAKVLARLAELAQARVYKAMPTSPALSELTSREREVLLLLREGYSNRAIAKALIIEVGTVKNHVHNILQKLNVGNRREAVRFLRLFENESTASGTVDSGVDDED
ncbi:MAG: response regulator transcription factor [Caldilineaceae bacterium]